jgi:hypothetical protein
MLLDHSSLHHVNESEEDTRSGRSETVLQEKGGDKREKAKKENHRKSEDLETMPDTVISIQLQHCLFQNKSTSRLRVQLSD